MSKKPEGPRQQAGLGVGLDGWETGSPDADPSVERGGKSLSPQGCWPRLRLPLPGLARGWAQELMEEEPPGTCELSPHLHHGAEGWSSSPQRQRGSVKAWPFIWEWPQAAAGRRTGLKEGEDV